MTHELADHHDPETLTPDFAAALTVHRSVPALSIAELCRQAMRRGSVQRVVRHVGRSKRCNVGQLCPTGERLAKKIGPTRKRRRRAA
jgi:hypothetical protein